MVMKRLYEECILHGDSINNEMIEHNVQIVLNKD